LQHTGMYLVLHPIDLVQVNGGTTCATKMTMMLLPCHCHHCILMSTAMARCHHHHCVLMSAVNDDNAATVLLRPHITVMGRTMPGHRHHHPIGRHCGEENTMTGTWQDGTTRMTVFYLSFCIYSVALICLIYLFCFLCAYNKGFKLNKDEIS